MIPDRIFLVGFFGSGTDEVGRALADKIDRPLFSTDAVIEASARMPLAELYRKEGESSVRQRERRALVAVATGPPGVIVTGPGTFTDRGNRRTIQQSGVSVFIDASLEECLARAIERGQLRPDDESNERFTTLYEQRRPIYEEADLIVEPLGRPPEEIADEIVQRLEDRVWAEKLG
ncbi:MAG: hypothetical protein D6718_02830 [Acidobacteria bacterium]|nr:MAG: hypothetical protein D6718_02830 [Acidobacteriota bacterium]